MFDLAAGDNLAVLKQAVVRLQGAYRPGDDLAGLIDERRGVVSLAIFRQPQAAHRRRPVGAGVLGPVLVRLMPPDSPAALLVPTAQHELERLVRPREIARVVVRLIGFEERDHQPGVVVVILVVAVAAGRCGFVAGDLGFRIPVAVKRREVFLQEGAVSVRLGPRRRDEVRKHHALEPHIIRLSQRQGFEIHAARGIEEVLLDVFRHFARAAYTGLSPRPAPRRQRKECTRPPTVSCALPYFPLFPRRIGLRAIVIVHAPFIRVAWGCRGGKPRRFR